MTQNKAVSNEQLAALLKQLIIDAPEFKYNDALGAPELSWLGRGAVYLEVSGTTTGLVSFRSARSNLNTMMHSREALLHPLYEAYSRLELVLPSSIQGAFIPGGEPWQGYSALVELLQKECNELMIVDPYLSSSFFTELAPHAGNPSRIRCLTARQAKNHAALLATANRWATDHSSGGPKIEVRYAKAAELHDRRLIFDAAQAWLVSQSLKDIAARSPASVTRADGDLSTLKAAHYEAVWNQAVALS